ncbi:MAG: succinylglutamate desuccinylase, partial [Alphaproteobacteria bacterium]
MARKAFKIGGATIAPGARDTVDLPLSVLSNHTPMSLPVQVIHGRKPGPVMFVSACVHGDEIIGVEIIRRLLRLPALRRLRGTLLAIPIVNAFGFINHSRYLPDRRDLNRSFPGSANGSLAARLAHLFVKEVVTRCQYGIDLHSAAEHRTNLPQIRVSDREPETRALAEAFGAPVILHSQVRDGSLRDATFLPVIYEARPDEDWHDPEV